jgi:4-amino-4-deoxy-L-arabinose transferase-like glycosyltransferase
MNRKKTISPIFIIFIIALLFRIVLVFAFVNAQNPPDDYEYGTIARSIISGQGFVIANEPTALKAPIYPYFLALVYKYFGVYRFITVQLIHALVGSFTVLILYSLTKRIFEYRTALIAAGLLALYPIHAYLTQEISGFIFFSFLIALLLLVSVDMVQYEKNYKSILCGLCMGITLLVDPAILAFIPPMLVWTFIKFTKSLGAVRAIERTTLIVAVCFLVILPWTIRNFMVFHRIVPIKSSLGSNLWYGNNELARGVYLSEDDSETELLLTKEGVRYINNLNEVDRNRYLGNIAIKYILEHPKETIKRSLLKFRCYWYYPTLSSFAEIHGVRTSKFPRLRNIIWAPVLMTGIIGMILSGYHRRDVSLIVLLFISFSALYSITIVYSPYRRIIEPEMLIFSAYSVSHYLNRLSRNLLF